MNVRATITIDYSANVEDPEALDLQLRTDAAWLESILEPHLKGSYRIKLETATHGDKE